MENLSKLRRLERQLKRLMTGYNNAVRKNLSVDEIKSLYFNIKTVQRKISESSNIIKERRLIN